MAKADPPKESSVIEKMNDHSLLLSSSKMSYYFNKWKTSKNVFLKFDDSNRPSKATYKANFTLKLRQEL